MTIQERMKTVGVNQRKIAEVTGKPLSLVCYVCQGIAYFPEQELMEKMCELLECEPSDLYTKLELRAHYPEYVSKQEPLRKRTRYGNPSVRIREDLIQIMKERGIDVAPYVNSQLEKALHEERAELPFKLDLSGFDPAEHDAILVENIMKDLFGKGENDG